MAATVPESTTRVVAVLGQLIWAYFGQLALGDRTRATTALKAFQSTYNQNAAAIRAVDPALPSSLNTSGRWDVATRWAAQSVVDASISNPDNYQRQINDMPLSDAEIGGWFSADMSQAAEGDSSLYAVNRLLAETAPAEGSTALTSYIRRMLDPTSGDAPTPDFDASQVVRNTTAAPSRGGVTTINEGLTVQANPTKWAMPTWALVALGIGGVAAAGVLLYYAGKKLKR